MIQAFQRQVVEVDNHELRVRYSVALADGQMLELDPNVPERCGLVFNYIGGANCSECGKNIDSRPGQRFCYACFTSLARCDLCIVSPDRCHYHLGTCREPDWGEAFCMYPHVVYIALSSVPKVGITRAGNEWARWAGQGAHHAMRIVSAPTRRAAGLVEKKLGRYLTDKTDWRRLVSGQKGDFALSDIAAVLRRDIEDFTRFSSQGIKPAEAGSIRWDVDEHETRINYPISSFAPATKYVLDASHRRVEDNLVGCIGGYLLASRGVLSLADLERGDIELTIGPTRQLEGRSQMPLF